MTPTPLSVIEDPLSRKYLVKNDGVKAMMAIHNKFAKRPKVVIQCLTVWSNQGITKMSGV